MKKRPHTSHNASSRNPRFKTSSINESRNFQTSSQKDNLSLERRLKDEEIMIDIRNGPLAESQHTIVSKQRVRQVPVSNQPKKLRNISTSSKKRGSSQFSMKQDTNKKNVYHIFGRQTSQNSDQVPAVKDDLCESVVIQPESAKKQHRKLLFSLNDYTSQPIKKTSAFEEQHSIPIKQYRLPKEQLRPQSSQVPSKAKKPKVANPMSQDHGALDFGEINSGVTYDKNGRGRQTAQTAFNDGLLGGESDCMSPNVITSTLTDEFEQPYIESQAGRNMKRRVLSSHTNELQNRRPDMHSRQNKARHHSTLQHLSDQNSHQPRREKKPKDIYALRALPAQSSKKLSLMTYNPAPNRYGEDDNNSNNLRIRQVPHSPSRFLDSSTENRYSNSQYLLKQGDNASQST